MGRRKLFLQASQVLYAFAIGLPFMLVFQRKLSEMFLGPLGGAPGALDLAGLLLICEAGLLIGCFYAAVLWIYSMRLFLPPAEIEAALAEPRVPVITDALLRLFRYIHR
ncbi:MAG: hypothetical protein ACT4O3_09165 [Elusimicrobiota bacterium]